MGKIGSRRALRPDFVKILQAIPSSQPTFMCIDALNECVALHRVKLLNSLKQFLEKSPSTRIFITGRPYIRAVGARRLGGRAITVFVGPRT